MKAISLWEPWASLVKHREKQIETRGRVTKHRGLLAIHATKSMPKEAEAECVEPGFISEALRRHGQLVQEGNTLTLTLHRGCVIAVAELYAVRRIHARKLWVRDNGETPGGDPGLWGNIRPDAIPQSEMPFGDYRDGRYAWMLRDIRPLRKPVPWKGAQWLFDVPDDLINAQLEGRS
jgi:hypothetical protein